MESWIANLILWVFFLSLLIAGPSNLGALNVLLKKGVFSGHAICKSQLLIILRVLVTSHDNLDRNFTSYGISPWMLN